MNEEEQAQDRLILDRYKLQKTIQTNPAYVIYQIKDASSGERAFAKVQHDSKTSQTVLHQAAFMQQLQGYNSIPLMIWSGKINQKEIVLITEQLGPTLSQLLQKQIQNKFSLITVCMIGQQILKALQTIHEKHIVYGNVSLECFRIGKRDLSKIYASSFMHCRRYRNKETYKHIEQKSVQKLTFISPFASFNRLSLLTCSRRDDLQSWLYLLMYLYTGTLPWLQFYDNNEQCAKRMAAQMQSSIANDFFLKLPKQMREMLEHVYILQFKEQPNYSFLRHKLKKMLANASQKHIAQFDWIKKWTQSSNIIKKSAILRLQTSKDRQSILSYYDPYQINIGIDKFENRSPLNKNKKQDMQAGKTNPVPSKCQLI